MNYVKSFNLLGVEAQQIPCITGEGIPTGTTVGAAGCLYMDDSTGAIYKCTDATDNNYTWESILPDVIATKKSVYLEATETILDATISAGVQGAGGTNDYRIVKYSVLPNVKYHIKASSGYRKDKYAFYDANGNVLSYEVSDPGNYAVFSVEVKAPEDATTLVVPYLHTANMTNPEVYYNATVYEKQKQYSGKKWAVFGDSLTAVNNRADTKYYDYIAEELGCDIVNYGLGGSGYKKREANNEAFYQRVLNIDVDAFDVLTIFGSFNDISSAEIGNVTDTGTDTLCGCINTTLDNYYSIAPFKPIGIVTPCPWFNSNPTNTESVQSQYVDALIAIAKKRGIPCLDLFHESGLRPWNADFVAQFYTENGTTETSNATHPNSEAHRIFLYPKFREFFKKML